MTTVLKAITRGADHLRYSFNIPPFETNIQRGFSLCYPKGKWTEPKIPHSYIFCIDPAYLGITFNLSYGCVAWAEAEINESIHLIHITTTDRYFREFWEKYPKEIENWRMLDYNLPEHWPGTLFASRLKMGRLVTKQEIKLAHQYGLQWQDYL